MDDIFSKWEEIKIKLKEEFDIKDTSYNIWINPLKLDHIENKTFYIAVPEDK